jgi:hypothetical protein
MEALPLVTADGRAAPGAFGRATTIAGGVAAAEGAVRKAPKTTQRYEADDKGRYAPGGAKARYYADDDKASLRDLVAAEKHGGGEDYDRNLANNIKRMPKYKGTATHTPLETSSNILANPRVLIQTPPA